MELWGEACSVVDKEERPGEGLNRTWGCPVAKRGAVLSRGEFRPAVGEEGTDSRAESSFEKILVTGRARGEGWAWAERAKELTSGRDEDEDRRA